MRSKRKVAVVTGDVTMDWNLARTRRAESGGSVWFAGDRTHACWQRGGAVLLANLIEAVADGLRQGGQVNYQVRQMAAPKKPVHPGDDQYHHSYAIWSLYTYGEWSASETAFQHLAAYVHAEINTLGYPKAALFGLCLALVASNLLAVVLAALRSVHGQESVDAEMSLSYIANDISTTYTGMMSAIPEVEWDVFARMSTPDMVATLLDLARRVNLRAYRKSPRGPKKTAPHM